MKADPFVSIEFLCKECGLTRDGVNWNIKKLKELGIISRVGPDKGGHWEIAESAIEIPDDRLGEKLGEKSDEWLGEKLGENRMTIIRCLTQNPSISTHRLAELLGMSTTAMDKNIKWLKDNGIIRHVGPAKGGRWEVIGK